VRSDEQLLAAFRAGDDEAFRALHDRHRGRLHAYVRQMLGSASSQDAEDVVQDVFARAAAALRRDEREVHVRAWLYRVAHNRCVDHLRRPVPAPADVFDVSRPPEQDPFEATERRDDLHRLVEDVGRLPAQQRSALLMREIDGLPYAELAEALEVTVPAVKSLLVRARVGLVEAAESRDADCRDIRDDLARSCDRGVKASAHARRHLRSCAGCREFRGALRGTRRRLAALAPAGAGPLALVAQLTGLGGAGAGGGALAGGGAATVAGGKVAAMVCTAALAGGAVQMGHYARQHRAPARAPVHAAAGAHSAPPVAPAASSARAGVVAAPPAVRAPARTVVPAVQEPPTASHPARPAAERRPAVIPATPQAAAPTTDPAAPPTPAPAEAVPAVPDADPAGAVAAPGADLPTPPVTAGAPTAEDPPSPAPAGESTDAAPAAVPPPAAPLEPAWPAPAVPPAA
jgi:RNA polymerase sigma factor (sigma-70 family)